MPIIISEVLEADDILMGRYKFRPERKTPNNPYYGKGSDYTFGVEHEFKNENGEIMYANEEAPVIEVTNGSTIELDILCPKNLSFHISTTQPLNQYKKAKESLEQGKKYRDVGIHKPENNKVLYITFHLTESDSEDLDDYDYIDFTYGSAFHPLSGNIIRVDTSPSIRDDI
jgi:hypothetical protein